MKCQNCCRQYFCKLVNNYAKTSQKCNNFKSWIYTKNYGEVIRIENTKDVRKKQ